MQSSIDFSIIKLKRNIPITCKQKHVEAKVRSRNAIKILIIYEALRKQIPVNDTQKNIKRILKVQSQVFYGNT